MKPALPVWALCASSLLVSPALAQSYYVSPTGSDNADGLTPATAWASVDKVNDTSFAPGAQILFERGGEWRDQLAASSSGTTAAPIVYGAYGTGGKPKFWGSDVISNASLSKVGGTSSTYQLSSSTAVNAVLADHSFYRSASLVTGSTDPVAQRSFVDANPGSWAYDSDNETLYVNTGGVDPASSSTTFTAAVRDDVVYSNHQSNLVFRDLVVEESAKQNAGYAFRVQGGENVRIENAEAYRAGKHHFGVINSGGFVGRGLYTSEAMPDQGYGGATAFVAFSDAAQSSHDNSAWIDCVAENNGPVYPAFVTHGTGVGDVLIQNMTVRGGPGIAIGNEAAYEQDIRVVGGHLENAGIVMYTNGALVDGVRMTGEDAYIDLVGSNNTVQNVLMTGAKPDTSYSTAVLDRGMGNKLWFNTIVLDPTSPGFASALATINPATDTLLFANVFDTPMVAIRQWFAGQGAIDPDFNLYAPGTRVIMNTDQWFTMTQWQQMGFDLNTLLADPNFVNELGGDFRLADGSVAIDRLTQALADLPQYDFDGNLRPFGVGYDLGAFEAVPEPTSGALLLVAALVAAGHGRRARRADTRQGDDRLPMRMGAI